MRNGKALSVTDSNGKAISITDNPNAGLDNIDFYAPFTTIDRMFVYAQDVVSKGEDFDGDYDAKYGFPTRMCFYNCGNETPPEVDGDIVITVSDFEKLP